MLAPRPTAGPALAFLQLLLSPANAALSGRLLLGIVDPTDELVARQGRDVLPGSERRAVGDQRRAQVCRQLVHHAAGHSLAAHAARITPATIDPMVLIGFGSNSNDINARPAVVTLTVVDLDSKLRPVAEALLTQGEELRGVCVATQVGMFKGRQVLLGVTDGRLLVQGMNRKFEPVGDAISLPPERIADASAEGAGGGWVNVGLAIMDGPAVTLKVRSTDGQKLKLTMMRGTGVFGKLSGGDTPRNGVEAVAAWFTEHATS